MDCMMTRALLANGAFNQAPLIVGDVGVRGGFDPKWELFANQCLQIGFEPSHEECARIEAQWAQKNQTTSAMPPRVRLESVALWDHVGRIPFYNTRQPENSSCFAPNQKFFGRLPDPSRTEVVSIVDIETTTLDEFHLRTGLDFDFLKLDVQGGELAVLQGGLGQLGSSVLGIVAEVEFIELYSGQPLFSDIDQFMRSQGFTLFDLEVGRRWSRKPNNPVFQYLALGQITYGEALYFWDPIMGSNHPPEGEAGRLKLLKLASLAEFFSLPDFAIEILMFAQDLGIMDSKESAYLIDLRSDSQMAP
jgi:FkbM family methyltransferase